MCQKSGHGELVQQLGLTHGGRSLRDRKTAISLKNPPFAAVSRYDRGAIVYLGRFVHKLGAKGDNVVRSTESCTADIVRS
jgi:hypothetical protein